MSTTDHTSDPMGDDLDELLDAALDAEASVDDRFDPQRFASLPVILSDLRAAEARATAAEVASRGYRERAEKAEAKAARSAGLLGHQSRPLTDAIASEVLRQKAVAWDEGKSGADASVPMRPPYYSQLGKLTRERGPHHDQVQRSPRTAHEPPRRAPAVHERTHHE